ncbi:TPA: fimbrial protein [Klebsiella aerogenes]
MGHQKSHQSRSENRSESKNAFKIKNDTMSMNLFKHGLLLAALIAFGWSSAGWAKGECTPVSGTHIYSYNFGNKQITDPSQDASGTVFKDAYTWNLGASTQMHCNCSGTTDAVYYTTKTTLVAGHNDGSLQYYKVNDYLEVATSIYVGGRVLAYEPTPWNDISNNYPQYCGSDSFEWNVDTGNRGELSLYIAKPFIGDTSINAKVVDIYARHGGADYGSTPVSSVNISGSVIVPQNCTVSPQTIPIHFGTMNSGDFTVKGQKPVSGSTQTINIPIKCTSATAYANLKVSLQATPSSGYPEAISTTNKDVGVLVTSEDGSRVLAPNSSTGYVPFMPDASGNATVTLKTYPVSTTGQPPVAGPFTALAYVLIDFA